MPKKKLTVAEFRRRQRKERNDFLFGLKLREARFNERQKRELQKFKEKRMPTAMRTARRAR